MIKIEIEEPRTEVKKLNQNKFFIYRRSKEEEKLLDESTAKIKRFCGMNTEQEKKDREIHNALMKNLSNFSL